MENKYKLFLIIILLLIICILAFLSCKRTQGDIMFGWPGTIFTDTGDGIYIKGTLSGSDLSQLVTVGIFEKNKSNNSSMIWCSKLKNQCIVYTITQIGPNQISDLPIPDYYFISSWNNSLIVATDNGNELSCTKTTINIDRKNEITEWIQEPFNQTNINCKNSTGNTYKWFIGKP